MVRASGEPQRVSAALTVLLAQDQAGWEGSGNGGELGAVRADGRAAVAVVLVGERVAPVGGTTIGAVALVVARQPRRPEDDAARGVAGHVVGRRHDRVAAAGAVEQVRSVRGDLAVAWEEIVPREERSLGAAGVGVPSLAEAEAGVQAVAETKITRRAATEGRGHAVAGDDELVVVHEGDDRVGVSTLEPAAGDDPLAANGHPEPGDVCGPSQREVAERPVRDRVTVPGAADRETDPEHLQRDRSTGRAEDEPQEVLVRPADHPTGAEAEIEARSRQLPSREHRAGVGLDRGRDILRLDGVAHVGRRLLGTSVLRGGGGTGVALIHGRQCGAVQDAVLVALTDAVPADGGVARGRHRAAILDRSGRSGLRTDLDLRTRATEHREKQSQNRRVLRHRRPPSNSCSLSSRESRTGPQASLP